MLFLVPLSSFAADVPVASGESLADAVAAASDGDRLLLAPGDHRTDGVLLGGRALELVGAGRGVTRLHGGDFRVLQIGDGDVRLESLTVDAEGVRSGLRVQGGDLRIVDADVVGATSFWTGAALRVDGGTVEIEDSLFGAAHASSEGGHLWVTGGTVNAVGTSFTEGTSRRGGSLAVRGGSAVTLEGCTFTGNTVDGGGSEGGAIDLDDSTLDVVGGTWSGNEVRGPNGSGGAIRAHGGAVGIAGSRFDGGVASFGGGALACSGGAVCTVRGTTLAGNQSGDGGAIHADGAGPLVLEGSLLCGNTATSDGGAVRVRDGDASVVDTWLMDNAAGTRGGAIALVGSGARTLQDVSLLDNGAPSGPALEGEGTGLTLVNLAVLWSAGGAPAVDLQGPVDDARFLLWHGNDGDGVPLGDPHVVADPLLPDHARHSCDPSLLVPADGSPLVDAGDPALLDADGSRSDLGAWGDLGDLEPVDLDGDGADSTVDCDDADPARFPGATERCDDADVDEDCDGLPDDRDPEGAVGTSRWCPDTDGDGAGDPLGPLERCDPEPVPSDLVGSCDDCDDGDPAVGASPECALPDDTLRYGTGCSEARGCAGGAAWMMVLPLPLLARRRR